MTDTEFEALDHQLYLDLGHGAHNAGEAMSEHAEALRAFLKRLEDTPLSGELQAEAKRLLGRDA